MFNTIIGFQDNNKIETHEWCIKNKRSMRDLYKVRITSETAESDFDREKFKGT